MQLYIISALAIFAAIAACAALYGFFEARRKFDEMKIQYAISSQKEMESLGQLHNIQNENLKLRERTTQAETSISMLKEQFIKIEAERIEALNAKDQIEKKYYEAKNQINLASQKVEESEKRIADWEKQREKAFKDAREAMFITGKEVFNKEAEEITKKTYEQFSKVVEKVTALSSNVNNANKDIQTVIKAMSSPTAVGQFSEIGLVNILKEYGLIEGQDFIIQYSIGAGDGAKRPDAVLFIRDNIFVIDSKASKFFLELAEAEGSGREQEVLESIKKSMNLHLRSLSSKNYKEAVLEEIRKTRKISEIGHVQTIMFLCNEAHVEKIAQADPQFITNAVREDIVISGPTGLQGLLAFARYSVARQNQDENQDRIILEITNLLGSVGAVVGHAAKVGSGIKAAAQNYEKLVSSINSNLLSKAGKINKLGVVMPANKPLPAKLESFEVNTKTIDAELVEENQGEGAVTLELVG